MSEPIDLSTTIEDRAIQWLEENTGMRRATESEHGVSVDDLNRRFNNRVSWLTSFFQQELDRQASRPTWVRVEDAKVGIRYWVTYQEYSEPPSVRIGMMDDDGLWSFQYIPGLKVGKNFIKAILPYTEPSPFMADSKGDER